MKFDRFIITGPLTLFKANVFGETSDNAWQSISEDNKKGLDLCTLVSVSSDNAFDALKRARDFRAQLLVDGQIINPCNYQEYAIERARSARTISDVADSMPSIAALLSQLVPHKIDAADAEQQIRNLMPERQISNGKSLKDLAADYLHQAIAAFDLETRDFIQIRAGNPNVIEAPADRDELRKMILEEGGVFAMTWQLGEGKSQFCQTLLNQCQSEDRTAAMLAPRKSHHVEHLGEATHYQIIKQTGNAGPVAVGTPNSICYLPEFEKYRTAASLLIADEYEQTRTHNAGKAVLSGSLLDRGLITHNTNNAALSAANLGAFVVVDAQTSEHSINELARMSGKKIIVSRTNKPQVKRKLKLHKNHESCIRTAQELLSNGGRVVLFADMAQSAQKDDFSGIKPTMLSAKPDARVLVINKEYVQNPDNAQALKNINETIEGHDLIIISPAINSGFSITTDNVDGVFVLASGTVLPTEFVQTLGRFRAMTEVHVSFEIVDRWLPTNPTDVLKSIAHTEIMATAYSADHIENLRTQPGVEQVINQIARDNKMREQYANRALIMAKYSGFEMERVVAQEGKKTGAMSLNDGKLQSEQERAEAVKTINRISEQQAKQLREKSSKTREEEVQLENFDMRVAYRTPELSLELIAADRNGWMRGIIKNWKAATRERTDFMTVNEMQRRRIIRKLFDCIDTNINTIKPNHKTAAQNLKAWAADSKLSISIKYSDSLIIAPMGLENQEDRPAFFNKAQADKFAKWIKEGEMKISGHSIRNRDALKAFSKRISPRMQGPGMVKKLLTDVMGLDVEKPENGVWNFTATDDFEMCYAMATADVDPIEYKRGDEQVAQDDEVDAQMATQNNRESKLKAQLKQRRELRSHEMEGSKLNRDYYRQLEMAEMQDAARARRNKKAQRKSGARKEVEAA